MSARILVVDDNEVNAELLIAMLASEHYFVSTAADGFEALAKIAAEKPDIVLLDVMMPGLDGFEACRRIKADPVMADIPVIMVTALSDVDDLVRGFEVGADDFVTKPFNGLALMARVRLQLRRKRDYESILEQALIEPLTGGFYRRYLEWQAARMGGYKFVVVMPEADPIAALQVAKRLRRRIGNTPVEGATVTVSIGVAASRPDEEEELGVKLQRADAALYEAKRT